MRLFLLLFLAFLPLIGDSVTFSEQERAWIKENNELLFTGDPNWLPYEAFDKKGNYIGIVAEHLKLVEEMTGLHFKPQVTRSWSDSLKIADEGKVSLVSGDAADKHLGKKFKAIDPYMINPIIIVMHHHAPYVEDLNTLQGQKIAIIKDYGYTAQLFETYPKMHFIEVENAQEGLLGVSSGKYDAMLGSLASIQYLISKMRLDELTIVGKTSVMMEVTLFVDKEEPLLYTILNKAIHAIPIIEQQKIIDRWNGRYKKEASEYRRNLILILLIMTLMAMFFVYNYIKIKLKKKRYILALEGANEATWNWDIAKDRVSFSVRFNEILGYSSHEYVCHNSQWINKIHPEDKPAFLKLMEENHRGDIDTYVCDYRMQHKDGSWKWIRMRAKTFFDKNAKALRMDGICSDITAEKDLSLELYRSQQLLHTIMDNIPVRIFWKDTRGIYLGCNRLFAEDIDQNRETDCIGKSDHEMPWVEQAQSYIDDDQTVMQSGHPKLNYEEEQTKACGRKMWLSTSKVPLKDENGEVIGILGAYHDITEHKQHQLDNEKKRKTLETAQEIGHLGSWEWNMDTGELNWSDEVYRIFGEIPQSFPATYEVFKSYIPARYQAGLEKAIADSIVLKKPYEYDHQIQRKDGSFRLVREAGYVRFDDTGKPLSMLGTILDINTLVEVKSTQRENEELTELLKKFDQNVIASNTDLRGNITYASEAFVKMSGYSLDELIGSPQNIVRHSEMPKERFAELWKTIREGKVWKGEIKNRKKDGSEYIVDTTISPIFDKQKKIIGYSSIRHDITHEKQAEQLHHSLEKKSSELLLLNKELEERVKNAVLKSKQKDHLMAQQGKLASMGEMIGNIAHQWRQPLNALGLLLQKQQIFFDRGLLTSEKLKESIDKGTLLINKMSSTIDDFRDFFKPNKEKTSFDVKEVIDDTLELIGATLYNNNISLNVDIKEGVTIYGYKNEFSQVILNLVNNAKDILYETEKSQGKITIRSSMRGNTVNICVSDNGGGIKADVIEHVFEPYFTTKEEGKGTGIGLYMSKMIIEDNMGGVLSVANDDKGAVFTISMEASASI